MGYFLLGASLLAQPYRPSQEIQGKVDSLLALMTLEEKVGQMTNIGVAALCKGGFYEGRDTLELDSVKVNRLLLKYHIGSVQNKGKYPPSIEEWNRLIGAIQEVATQKSRLGIPILYGNDGVHGANYTEGSILFPHQIGVAATWEPRLAEAAAQVTAYELRASGIPWNFGPVVDVAKQPLWGRMFESFGEDTYLNMVMGNAMVRGLQGNNLSDPYRVGACLKHFAGYGMAHNGKDRSPVYMPERLIRQVILPPFEAAIQNGVPTVMINSGTINGIPCHTNKYLITDILKGEMRFQGFTISDWEDIDNLVKVHRVAVDEKDAVLQSVLAGLDMCMDPYDESFAVHLAELVREGAVPVARVDDAVRRILGVKFALGLFEQTLHPVSEYPDFGSEAFTKSSYEAAVESMTLLKNEEDLLPISKDKKVLVTGVAGNSLNYLNGGWSRTWAGVDTTYNDPDKLTIYEALQDILGQANVSFVQGTGYTEEINIEQAVETAKEVDYVVVCVGEQPATEKPSDIDDLSLPQVQQDLVTALSRTGKPIILVMVQGRPRIIREIEPLCKAILMAYLPGNEGGRAITNVLLGDENPSGKLPYTYPRYTGSIWAYDHLKSDDRGPDFGFGAFQPQFEFGYGLSYTTFSYSDLKVEAMPDKDEITISVTLTNTGRRKGKEVIQVYVSDLVASVSPAVKQLKRFRKIELTPGLQKEVKFKLTSKDLAFVNQQNQWVVEPGEFQLRVGNLSHTFNWKK
ncbi:MAG: glycoside hydrolase family 3 N-terminal domain-containing protein [Bacteroidota bacterium]